MLELDTYVFSEQFYDCSVGRKPIRRWNFTHTNFVEYYSTNKREAKFGLNCLEGFSIELIHINKHNCSSFMNAEYNYNDELLEVYISK